MSNVAQKQVPEGYRQSDVGVIPEDWEVVELGDIGKNLIGLTYSPNDVVEYGTLVLRSSNVQNNKLAFKNNVFVNMELPSRVIVKEGDILVCVRNGSKQLIGKCALIDKKTEGVAFGAFMSIYRTEFGSFIFYQFQSDIIQRQIDEIMGATINQITNKDMAVFKVPLPNDAKEQAAIANALSDVDALITSLEKLIAKKHAIKTAAMQQLLTGKKRLPPFDQTHTGYKQTELGEIPEDWVVTGLGDLFEPKITRKRVLGQEEVTFIGMQDVTEDARISSSHRVKYYEIKSGFTYFERGDVLVAKITPCFENGKGGYTDAIGTQIGFGSTEFHVLRARDNVVSKYLYYFTNTVRFRSELEGEMVGSAGHRRVPFSSLQKFRVALTLDPKEQRAIAQVLTDMDADVDALVSRLNKTQQLKQGMMQELLTGRTRLI